MAGPAAGLDVLCPAPVSVLQPARPRDRPAPAKPVNAAVLRNFLRPRSSGMIWSESALGLVTSEFLLWLEWFLCHTYNRILGGVRKHRLIRVKSTVTAGAGKRGPPSVYWTALF